jgi:ATP phosphoribosyltransferase
MKDTFMPVEPLKITLPKGRIQKNILHLLQQIGLEFSSADRSYRPVCKAEGVEAKVLKPQNIPPLIALARHDCGFTGWDWINEQGVSDQVIELLDLRYDPVRIVAAVPEALAENDQWRTQPLVLATEYQKLAKDFVAREKLNALLVRTYGATEALPPEDADMIVDNTSSGATLKSNRLVIVADLLKSSTRFVCSREAWANPAKRKRLEEWVMLMKSVLNAQERVLLEMNVLPEALDAVVALLPCMRAPTISSLYHQNGFAVKAAIPAHLASSLIPKVLAAGASDILEYRLEKIVPDLSTVVQNRQESS